MGRRLDRWDRRNQVVSDWLMKHPDAGTRSLAYAKLDATRRKTWAIILGVIAVAMVAQILWGWIAYAGVASVGVLLATAVSRKFGWDFQPGKRINDTAD